MKINRRSRKPFTRVLLLGRPANQSGVQSVSSLKVGYLWDPVAQKQRKATDEEFVRQEMIQALVYEYGYPLTSMATEFPIKVGSDTRRIDIAVFPDDVSKRQENIALVVECKKPKIKLEDKSDGVGQLISYMASSPAAIFGLWTNGAGFERQVVHRVAPAELKRVDYDIPRHGDAKPLDRAPLLVELVPASSASLKWRFRKCHNIISQAGDDKMTAFWEFLKVIQTKIEDEKEDKERSGFYVTPDEMASVDGLKRVSDRLSSLYNRLVVPKYGSLGMHGATINVRPHVLARITAELQDYSLLNTGPTVKGAAYEEIVGANLRGDKGEFFTPRSVIEAAVAMLEVGPADVCFDPACGSGGFSVAMLLAGRKAVEAQYAKRKGDWSETIREQQRAFSSANVLSNDINRNLANACRMNMMMNNDGAQYVFDQDILEAPHNWTADKVDDLKKRIDLKPAKVGAHHFWCGSISALCTNPPFGNDITRTERHLLDQYDLGRGRSSQIVEILFIERCIQLLKPGMGRAALVVPQSILNNPGLKYVRDWLLAHTKVLAVVELPVETFLISGREGTGTLTAILVVQRREINDTAAILDGQPLDQYPIFMGVVNDVGYDRRGKTTFRKEADGTEIAIDVPVTDPLSGEVVSVNKEKVVANDLPLIVRDYINFREDVRRGRIAYDASLGTYKKLAEPSVC